MSKPLDIEPIKARDESATPGPWKAEDGGPSYQYVHKIASQAKSVFGVHGISREDAEFVASSRSDVAELLAEVERLRKGLAQKVTARLRHMGKRLRAAETERDRLRRLLQEIGQAEPARVANLVKIALETKWSITEFMRQEDEHRESRMEAEVDEDRASRRVRED